MLFLNHVFTRRRVLNPLSQLTELIGLTMINLKRFTIFGNNLTCWGKVDSSDSFEYIVITLKLLILYITF